MVFLMSTLLKIWIILKMLDKIQWFQFNDIPSNRRVLAGDHLIYKKEIDIKSFKNHKFLIYVDFVLNLWITMITRTQSCSFLTFLFKIDKQILSECWHVYSQFLILGQVIWPDIVFAKCKTNLFLLFLYFFLSR